MDKVLKVGHLLMLVGFVIYLIQFNLESQAGGASLDTSTMLLFTQMSLMSIWLLRNR
ncbi:hypothetical protein [Marininema halotolerans]|uniref:Uncharacterized protein n=1 Tax=Marininema halotolerans TaxID=1155944 RepID=A0A1I6QJ96_9BACL|nr:hypothetical protein [Marininema halotolerans]SFS52539.1 hypothetical protein SAMN05444972_103188 [Marininema halotolerans]